jgi:hypothetical protein
MVLASSGLRIIGTPYALATSIIFSAMWSEKESDVFGKIIVTLIVSAVAFAYAFLLVLSELDDGQKWGQPVSSVTIGILALQIIVAVWGEIKNNWYLRFMAVVTIIVGLETIVIPILMKLRKGDGRKIDKIVLEKIDGDIYRDSAGEKYRLTKIDMEPAAGND